MLRLRGKPLGGQVSLGSAAVLRAPNGIPMLPARLVAQMARAQRDAPIEPVEIVVVARDFDAAASLMLPWARVVGIVAEHAAEGAEFTGMPTVVGIEGVLEKIDDDALVLIDGERGIVLVDPDGVTLAAYQAERERIAPRRRIFLDYSHQPAVSLDGRAIRVMGRAGSLDEVRAALDSGADTLYVPAGSALLDPSLDDEAHLDSLLNLAEAASGKPVTIAWDVEVVTAANILQAARRMELTVSVPLATGAERFREIQDYLQETREELLAEEIDFADVRIAGSVDAGDEVPMDLGNLFVSRIVVTDSSASIQGATMREWLADLALRSKTFLLPVEIDAPDADTTSLLELLAVGASGVIVSPPAVSVIKDQVRSTDLGDLRELLRQNQPATPVATYTPGDATD